MLWLERFEEGLFLWDGKTQNDNMSLASTNFHATVSGGAAIDKWGQLVLALMGTGVYVWKDGTFLPHLPKGPVTDSVAVKRVGDTVVVLDFDSVPYSQCVGNMACDAWCSRSKTAPKKMRLSILAEMNKKNGGRLIPTERCISGWIKNGSNVWYPMYCVLTVMVRTCFLRQEQDTKSPIVSRRKPVHSSIKNVSTSRSAGKWVATSKALFFEDVQMERLSGAAIQFLIPDGDGVLLAQKGRSYFALYRSMSQCGSLIFPMISRLWEGCPMERCGRWREEEHCGKMTEQVDLHKDGAAARHIV